MIGKIFRKLFSFFGLEIKKANRNRALKTFGRIGKNTNTTGLNLEVRNTYQDRICFEAGDDCMISGQVVFETTTGHMKIGNRTFIGGGLFVCINSIEIGNDVMFSWGCTVMDNNAHSVRWIERKDDVANWKKGVERGAIGKYKDWLHVKSAPITIKDKVWIGFNVIILKGVTIGEGSIIGAGSVVTSDIPDWSIVAGNPAKVIRTIPEEER